nr:pyroglutamyl-peptidase 1-like protein [Procambarus clarkii]
MGSLISLIMGSPSLPVTKNCPVIYITGFSKFWHYSENSSEMAVCILKELNLEKKLGCKIVFDILNVSYEDASSIIPKKWKELNPQLVIHIGMKCNTDKLILEQVARNSGYEYNDVHRKVPKDKLCIPGGEEEIKSGICMETVSKTINENGTMKSEKSTNAGWFICEYVYYLSLHQNRFRSAFIHVPPIRDNISASDIAAGLAAAIEALYHQALDLNNKK